MSATGTIGITSWNICGLPSSLPAPRLRATKFCRWLEESSVDVIHLQEVWTRQLLEVIRERLPSFTFVAWRRGFAGQPAGGLASFSRLPLGNVSFTSFRSLRASAGSPVFRASKAVNSRLQGVLTAELAGHPVLIGNVHLSANRDGDWSVGNRHYGFQRAQLTALHDTLRLAGARGRGRRTELVIASGDLNIPSSSPLYRQIVEDGAWRDPFAGADLPTFHAELLPSGRAPHRIDCLLVCGDAQRYPVLEAGVVFDEPVSLPGHQRTFLSDHLALTVRVAAQRY